MMTMTGTTPDAHQPQAAQPQAARHALLIFRLADQFYALPIADVVEVAAMVEVVQVAGQPAEMVGVVNRRGSPLPLIDLSQRFGLGRVAVEVSTLFIVAAPASDPARQVGLVVDAVEQVAEVDAALRLPISPEAAPLVNGVIQHQNQLIQVLAVAPLAAVYSAQAVEI
jgi:chemotaxis signal transduction protein